MPVMAQYHVALPPIELLAPKYVWSWQESAGGDDLRASPAKVLPGVSGWEVGGPECQTGGASGEDEPAGAEQQEPRAGTGHSPARGEETSEER